jgi:hypothetical protein
MKIRSSRYQPFVSRKTSERTFRTNEIWIGIDKGRRHMTLETWQLCQWNGITRILAVKGVLHYTVDRRCIGITYEADADVIRIAATCIAIVAAHLKTPLRKVKLRSDILCYGKKGKQRAEQVWRHARTIGVLPEPPQPVIYQDGTLKLKSDGQLPSIVISEELIAHLKGLKLEP